MSGRFLRQCAGIVFTCLVVVLLARGAATAESSTNDQVIVVTSRAIRQAAVFHQEPEYPPTARQFRLSGEVVVEVTVGTDGKVENVEVTKGRPILNEAVTRAVRKWSFSPFMVEGHPRKVKSTLSFNFQL
jgi:TonB family protein